MAGLYIHIPYCRSKCAYCDFFSTPLRGDADVYTDALVTELQLRRDEIAEPIRTVYLGGGTPSMLGADSVCRLIERLSHIVDFDNVSEMTIEMNPEDVDDETLRRYKSVGINRISIGVQSFDDDSLRAVGRNHSAVDSRKALDCLATDDINYSADLIFGLPEQTPARWEASLGELLSYRPPHFSAYLLSYEQGTRLYARMIAGKVDEADNTTVEAMYVTLIAAAADNGYEHYEISNYARPGFHSRHNSSYWDMTPYVGLGAAAHSFDGHSTRRVNPRNIAQYLKAIASGSPAFETETETPRERLNDYIITSLRTSSGLKTSTLSTLATPDDAGAVIAEAQRLAQRGELLVTSDGYAIHQRNMLSADSVMRQLILTD